MFSLAKMKNLVSDRSGLYWLRYLAGANSSQIGEKRLRFYFDGGGRVWVGEIDTCQQLVSERFVQGSKNS